MDQSFSAADWHYIGAEVANVATQTIPMEVPLAMLPAGTQTTPNLIPAIAPAVSSWAGGAGMIMAVGSVIGVSSCVWFLRSRHKVVDSPMPGAATVESDIAALWRAAALPLCLEKLPLNPPLKIRVPLLVAEHLSPPVCTPSLLANMPFANAYPLMPFEPAPPPPPANPMAESLSPMPPSLTAESLSPMPPILTTPSDGQVLQAGSAQPLDPSHIAQACLVAGLAVGVLVASARMLHLFRHMGAARVAQRSNAVAAVPTATYLAAPTAMPISLRAGCEPALGDSKVTDSCNRGAMPINAVRQGSSEFSFKNTPHWSHGTMSIVDMSAVTIFLDSSQQQSGAGNPVQLQAMGFHAPRLESSAMPIPAPTMNEIICESTPKPMTVAPPGTAIELGPGWTNPVPRSAIELGPGWTNPVPAPARAMSQATVVVPNTFTVAPGGGRQDEHAERKSPTVDVEFSILAGPNRWRTQSTTGCAATGVFDGVVTGRPKTNSHVFRILPQK